MKKGFSKIVIIIAVAAITGFVVWETTYQYMLYAQNAAVQEATAELEKKLDQAKTVPKETENLQTSKEDKYIPATPASSERIVDQGVTWKKPEKLGDLGLFAKFGDSNGYEGTSYFKVGITNNNGEIILAKIKVNLEEPGGLHYNFHRFIKRSDTYIHIDKNSEKIDGYTPYRLNYGPNNPKIENKSDSVLQSLLPNEKITYKSTNLIKQDFGNSDIEFTDSVSGKKVGETQWGDLYYDEVGKAGSDGTPNIKANIKIGRYFIKLNDSTKVVYEPKPVFMRDDNTFDLKFSDEKAKSMTFFKIQISGCGLGVGVFPLTTVDSSSKKLLGESSDGSKVFYIDDQNNSLVKAGYEAYSMDGMKDKKPIEDFIKEYGMALWTDDYGSTIVYLNSKFSPAVECGKPVIYLYPEKETVVSVKVGAKMTKSEPIYDGGWEALAKPNGELVVDGKKYDSLFWEGLGYGQYPVVNSGTIVERQNVKNIIEKQLRSMNLNQKETVDFLEFWLPKMPETPFVRLTWFTNKELDRLAPLQINPRPDSVIRVFLDFEGLNEKVNITPQILPTFQRTGFTAVEWGGLLKGK